MVKSSFASARPRQALTAANTPFPKGGPAAELIGDTVVVCCRGRKQEFPDDAPGQYRTSLLTLDRANMKLNWHTNLPTEWGGDLSYAGILPLDDERFLLSFYDGELYEKGVPKRSDVKLAEIRIA